MTVSARWTIELVYNLTVGGVSRSHPKNHPVALPSSANINQQGAFEARGNLLYCTYTCNPLDCQENINLKHDCSLTPIQGFCALENENLPLCVRCCLEGSYNLFDPVTCSHSKVEPSCLHFRSPNLHWSKPDGSDSLCTALITQVC